MKKLMVLVMLCMFASPILAKDIQLDMVEQKYLPELCKMRIEGKSSVYKPQASKNTAACYYSLSGWRGYEVLVPSEWKSDMLNEQNIHYVAHECKHVAVGNFHEVGTNGDESDLDKYRECAVSLLTTGKYTMK